MSVKRENVAHKRINCGTDRYSRGLDSSEWVTVLLLFTETFRQIRLFIDEHFGRENVAERRKGLPQVVVTEFLRQVVNKQIGALWTFLLTQSAHQRADAAARSASGAAYAAAAAASAAAAWRRSSETRIGWSTTTQVVTNTNPFDVWRAGRNRPFHSFKFWAFFLFLAPKFLKIIWIFPCGGKLWAGKFKYIPQMERA